MKIVCYYLFVFLLSAPQLFAQCEAILPFQEKEMVYIQDVYQFQFLHKKPINKLDTLVAQLVHPNQVIDSAYFKSISPNEVVKHLMELLNYEKIIEDIGKQRTPEAFLILNLPNLDNLHQIDDLSPFHSLIITLQFHQAAKVLNTYFLKGRVNTNLSRQEFETQVGKQCRALQFHYFKKIKYCKLLQGDARKLYDMNQVDPKFYDSVVEFTIRKYLNKNPVMKGIYSKDSILIEVLQIPFVVDVLWDDCYPKVTADDFMSEDRLGVIMHVGEDENHQKHYVQRVYTVTNHAIKGQKDSFSPHYDVDFISRIRRICHEDD